MSLDDLERAMQFLVSQQADWQAKQDALSARHSEQIANLNEAMVSAFTAIERLVAHGEETDRRIAALTARMDQTNARLDDTIERLDTLILVVEKHFSGNGHKPPQPPPAAA